MGNAVLLEDAADRDEAEPGVKRLHGRLGMHPGLAPPLRARQIQRCEHQGAPDPVPALRRQHRDPLDLGDPAALEQADAQGAGGLAVDRCQQMARLVVLRVELERLGDPLLGHEHAPPDGARMLDLGRRPGLADGDGGHDRFPARFSLPRSGSRDAMASFHDVLPLDASPAEIEVQGPCS